MHTGSHELHVDRYPVACTIENSFSHRGVYMYVISIKSILISLKKQALCMIWSHSIMRRIIRLHMNYPEDLSRVPTTGRRLEVLCQENTFRKPHSTDPQTILLTAHFLNNTFMGSRR